MFESFLTKTGVRIRVRLERLKNFLILLALLGLIWRDTVVFLSPGISFSPFFLQYPSWEHSNWHPHCIYKQSCPSSLQFSLVYNRNGPYSKAGARCHGSQHLTSWEDFYVMPTTDSDHITRPLFTRVSAATLWPCPFTEHTKLTFIIHFQEFLMPWYWEEDIQFHLDTVHCLRGATKKEASLIKLFRESWVVPGPFLSLFSYSCMCSSYNVLSR